MNRAERRRREKQGRQQGIPQRPSNGPSRTPDQLLSDAIRAHDSGNFGTAYDLAKAVVHMQPRNAIAWHLLGRLAMRAGQGDEAIAHFNRALRSNPDHTPALMELGDAYLMRGDFSAARSTFETLITREPTRSEAHNGLGHAVKGLGNWEAARDAFQHAIALAPDQPNFHRNLGMVQMELGNPAAAVIEAEKAIARAPDDPNTLNLLGRAQQALGQLDKALESFRHAITADANFAPAHRNLAELKTHSAEDADIQAMRRLFEKDETPPRSRMHLAFGLGKAFDDLGQPEKAFGFYRDGNALRRAKISFSIEEACNALAGVATAIDPAFLQRHGANGIQDTTPIFIVGMPRCGSTLVERILARQPGVYGAGELVDAPPIRRSDLGLGNDDVLIDLKDYGRRYLTHLRAHAPDAERIVDKNLGNFEVVGAIAAMFPRASIIHCTRHPMDTCLSIFMRSFRGRHGYAYDLRELGLYYRAYRNLMDHWHSLLTDRLHTIRYEDLVADETGETQKLLRFCGLESNVELEAYTGSDDIVLTSSNAQVRRPIYGSAVARWEGYADHLAPLIEALGLDPKPH